MKNKMNNFGTRGLSFLLAFVLSFSLIIPTSMADDEIEDAEDESAAFDVDTEVTEITEDEEDEPAADDIDDIEEPDPSPDEEEIPDEEPVQEDESEYGIMPLADTNLYTVSALDVTSITDGAAPWDNNDNAGNDSSDSNGIVRSFDYIYYSLGYTTAARDGVTAVDEANLMVEFTLPADPAVAEFSMSTLNWCVDPVITYYYGADDNTGSTTWDKSRTVTKQVLTGKRELKSDSGSSVSGNSSLYVGIYVKGAANETVIQPTFTAYMEGNSIETEAKTVTADIVTVSAAPKYNIRLYRNTLCDSLGYFDLTKGTMSSTRGSDSDVYGRIEGYGITVQLYNDSAAKGLKGIELPTGEITFNVEMTTTIGDKDMTEEDDYHPVLWNYEEATADSSKKTGKLGRSMAASGAVKTSYAYLTPGNKLTSNTNSDRYCYDGGSWSMTQSEEDYSLSVTIDGDYLFDTENFTFPEYGLGDTATSPRFGANIGCFSAGYFQVIAAFPDSESGQNLSFKVEVTDMKAASVSGQQASDEMTYSDNTDDATLSISPTGTVTKYNWYRNESRSALDNSGSSQTGSCYSYRGATIQIACEIKYDGDTPLYGYNFLQKFDDEALEVVPTSGTGYSYSSNVNSNSTCDSITVLYAAKPDKTGWSSDTEMKTAKEENLIYFTSLDALEKAGFTCVGFLYEVRGTYYVMTGSGNYLYMKMKVLDSAEVNSVYQTVNTLRAWQQGYGEPTSWTNVSYDKAEGAYGWGETSWTTGDDYHDGYTAPTFIAAREENYTKTSYTNGTRSGHTNGNQAGDSMLIIGDKATVSIAVADKTGTATKSAYDLDSGENTVTYEVTPAISAVDSLTETDNLTLTVTLPNGLTYITDSAEIDPDSVTLNSDGTTTIIWTYENVEIGKALDSFTFSCTIGAAGTSHDVVNGETLTVQAKIRSDADARENLTLFGNISEATISVIYLAVSAISKTAENRLAERGEDITFNLYYANKSTYSQKNDELLDILPYNEDGRGSSFSGNFRVTEIKIDLSEAPETWKEDQASSDHTVYIEYTTENKIRSYSRGDIEELLTESAEKEDVTLDGFYKLTEEDYGVVNESNKTITWDFSDPNLDIPNATALYFRLNDVEPKEYVTISVTLSMRNGQGDLITDNGESQQTGDEYANEFYQYYDGETGVVTSGTATATVVNRDLTGLAWIDADQNGIRGENEKLLTGYSAALYRTTPSESDESKTVVREINGVSLYPAYDVYGSEINAISKEDMTTGEYAFESLEAGTYYVVFSDIPDEYGMTARGIGSSSSDSDAVGVISDDKNRIDYAYIPDIVLPAAEDMTASSYVSANNDMGVIIPTTDLKLDKVNAVTQKSLSGAVFNITDEKDNALTFLETEDETETYDAIYTLSTSGSSDITAGHILISGLEAGTYTLSEKTAPSSYKLLDNQFTITAVMETHGSGAWTVSASVSGDSEYIRSVDDTVLIGNDEQMNITVTKIWDDAENQDGKRPESITVRLYANGTEVQDATLKEASYGFFDKIVAFFTGTTLDSSDQWTHIWEDLPVYDGDTKITYTVEEVIPEGYEPAYEYSEAEDGMNATIINSYEPETAKISGSKTWVDNDNAYDTRPAAITVRLLADGAATDYEQTVSADDDWTWTFEDVPVYSGGKQITYTLAEDAVEGYDATYPDDTYDVVNTLAPGKTSVTVTKVWDDAENQDGKRPESITVRLYANGTEVEDATLKETSYGFFDQIAAFFTGTTLASSDQWTHTWEDLPVYDGVTKITYSVKETSELPEGYESTSGGLVENTEDGTYSVIITNSYTPETNSVSGTITWVDGNNQDGLRPDSVTVQVFGTVDGVGTVWSSSVFSVTAPDDPVYDDDGNEVWSWSIDGLDVYYGGGNEILYSAIYTDVDPDVYSQSQDNGLDITYSYTPETTTISVSKTWVDNENAYETRPQSITIRLYADGVEIADRSVTAADGWSGEFEDLPVYRDGGKVIDYSITEDKVENYNTDIDGYSVTNTLAPGETSVSVTKKWDDAENQDGKRPERVTATLLQNGVSTGKTLTLSDENEWKGTFLGLETYDDNQIRFEYTVQEDPVDDYDTEITGNAGEGFVITNSYTPEKIDITGEKIWDDADDQDGLRPGSVTICLYADGTAVDETAVTADDEGKWTFTFAGLDKYAAGREIVYTVSEDPVDGYEDPGITGSAEEGFTVTNTHTPETIDISGVKVWNDDDDRDGLRPKEITVTLLADDGKSETASLRVVEGFWGWFDSVIAFFSGEQTVKPDENGNWNFSFTDLPKYRDGGIEIVYSIEENEVDGYETAIGGDAENGFTIANTHQIETVTVSGSKFWDDEADQDGKRPKSIRINLLDGSEPVLDQNGDPVTAVLNRDSEDGEGKWDFSFEDLPKYHDGGKEYSYSIREEESQEGDLDEYVTSYDGFNVTNSYTPEKLNGDGTLKVVLTWDDEADNDGIRPGEVNVTLTKNNTAVEDATLTLTADETDEDGNWTGTFTGLPRYENGKEIYYSIQEDYLSGYTFKIEVKKDADGNTYVQLTNVHVSVKEDIEVTKIWDDADNQDGLRPDSITVRLLTNGNLYKTVTLTADTEGVTVSGNGNVWTYTMKDIPVDKNGVNIEYTMIEVDVENYSDPEIETFRGDEITDNGVTYQPYSFTVTNSHEPAQIEIKGTKVWDDGSDQDGKRPQYVTANLYAGEGNEKELVKSIDVTAPAGDTDGLTDGNTWAFTFGTFDRYSGGKEIIYTVTEETVEDYKTKIDGSASDGFTIKNSYTPETTTISGSKTWLDDNDVEGLRPESITVRLHANGNEKIYEQTVKAGDDWSWDFADVPVYSDGQKIDYTLTEDAVDDYDAAYTFGDDGSLDVTNTLSPGETSVTVAVNWDDQDNQDGIRPEFVTVALLDGDGEPTDYTLTLSAENNWTGSFTKLEEYAGGTRIPYTVEIVSIDGYSTEINGNAVEGFVITNRHTPETTELSVSKVWDDADDQDGIRPDYVTIHLLADGETAESRTITAEDDWKLTVTDLDRYAGGSEIVYSVEEVHVPEGYEYGISGNAADGYTVTNIHEPEQIGISGTKTWNDGSDQDGIRPESVTLFLWADGKQVTDKSGNPVSTVVEPDAEENWSYTFTDLDKYANGSEIEYSVTEDVPDGYNVSYPYSGYDVTNTHTPELLNGDGTLGVIMRWDDEDNRDGLRPARTTVTLTVNGVPDESATLVLSDASVDGSGNWIGSFEGLPRYADGEEIAYSIEEGVMNGYTYSAELVYDEVTGLYYIEITNTHAAVTSDITVTKIWDDQDDQDGIRPGKVTVDLFSNGSAVESVTITPGKEGVTVSNDGNSWSYTFANMPVDQNGEAIVYTLDEVDVGSYSHTIQTSTENGLEKDGVTYTEYGFTVTNSHTPAVTSVSVTKTWDDNHNQDGARPASLVIELMAGGMPATDENGDEITGTMVPDQDGIWTYTFAGLDKYAGGKEIEYSVEEFDVAGYEEVSLTGDAAGGYVITNRHTPETTSISGTKIWNDDDNEENMRPESIQINLYANSLLKESKTVTAADGWKWTFEDLPVYSNGQKITYITTETAIENYDTDYSGFNLINTLDPGETSVTVSKHWEDADDQDGIRPESVTVTLLKNGEMTDKTLTLSEDNNWKGTFTGLDMRTSGVLNTYTVQEESTEGYTSTVSGDASTGFMITNSHTPATISVSGTKTWDDNNNQDGKRPDEVTMYLLADGERVTDQDGNAVAVTVKPDQNGEWNFTFEDLPEYRDGGTKIVYSFSEAGVCGYTYDVDTVTNTHEPELLNGDGTLRVVLVWEDEYNNDGIRPEEVSVQLTKDSVEVKGQSLTLTGEPTDASWTGTFTGLYRYEDGREISYSVMVENTLPGYDYDIQVLTDADGKTYVQLTNVHVSVKEDIEVTKIWDDAGDQDRIRPESITVWLLTDGDQLYRTVTLTADTEGVTVSENGNVWTYTMEGIPVDKNGENIDYSLIEVYVDSYSDAKIETFCGDEITDNGVTYKPYSFTVTNSHTPEVTECEGEIRWDDADNQDGIRPQSVTLYLYADGTLVDTVEAVPTGNGNTWIWSFTDLPMYKNGEEIGYTVTQEKIDGYETAYVDYQIINSHTPETIDIPVEKTWNDNDNTYGHRPDSVQAELLADGIDTGIGLTLSEDNNWSGVFEDLAKYAAGREIEYIVQEISDEALQYYTPKISGSTETGFTIVNHREYFDLDEEIVVDEDDRDSWVKNESVNAYNAIEIEMSTYLPYIDADELENGEFTMNFHEVLDHDMVLDEIDADFTVSIAGYRVSHDYYTISIDPDDGCSFHVDVDLTALYVDGVITEDDLQGETELMVFFYADLEGTGLNGSYKSTAWYEVYDGDEWQYTSNEDVVEFYTYEILVLKYDASALEDDDYEGAALAGAVLGLYYDADGENPVIRNGEPYIETSGKEGEVMFYGLAEGTYYVMELEAPDGYVLSNQAVAAAVNQGMDGYIREILFANEPAAKDEPRVPEKTADVGDGTEVSVGDEITYTITYYNHNDTETDVTIVDILDDGVDFLSATEGGIYDENAHQMTWTIENAAPLTEGSVDLTVLVNENADRADGVSNTAAVQIGDEAFIETNTVVNPVEPEEPVPVVPPEKSVDVGEGTQVSVGDELTYNITYYNNNDTEADVQIIDVLDNGVDFVSTTEGGVYDADAHSVTWTIENTAAQTEGSVELTVTVNENADRADGVSNTASVQIGNGASADTNTVNNPMQPEETTAGPVDPEKSVNVGEGTEVSAGEELTYTIKYYNNYNEAVTVEITDALDDGVDFVSATEGGVYDAEAHAVTWTIENAAPQTEGSVELTVTVNESADRADGVSNTASVQIGDDAAVDTNTVTNPLKSNEETPVTSNPNNGNNGGNNGGTTSGNGGGGTTGTGRVKTGEIIEMSFVGAAALAAVAGIIATIVSRKRRENEE